MHDARPVNALTIDVEDYFHVSGFADRIRPSEWDNYPYRAGDSTRRLLELLAERGVRATFFVLGWVAERDPVLVREIAAAGHEVGCHSHEHRLVYDLPISLFRADLRRSRDVLEQRAGVPVTSYRAPSFSITRRSAWALEVLVEEGFRDDSSLFPTRHDRYGVPGSPVTPYVVETPAGPLREFPGTVRRVGGLSLPVSGGGYFRLLPGPFVRSCLRAVNERERRPFVFYLHPWEIDPDQPRLPGRWSSRLRHYVNLASTETKLERLLDAFRFDRLDRVLDARETRMPHYTVDELVGPPRRRDVPVSSSEVEAAP